MLLKEAVLYIEQRVGTENETGGDRHEERKRSEERRVEKTVKKKKAQ